MLLENMPTQPVLLALVVVAVFGLLQVQFLLRRRPLNASLPMADIQMVVLPMPVLAEVAAENLHFTTHPSLELLALVKTAQTVALAEPETDAMGAPVSSIIKKL